MSEETETVTTDEVKMPKGVNIRDKKCATRYFKCLLRMHRYVAKVAKRHPELGGESEVRILFETSSCPDDVLEGIKKSNKEAVVKILQSVEQ